MNDFDEHPDDQRESGDDWDDEWDEQEPKRGRDMTLVYAVVAAAIVIVLAVVLTRPSDDEPTASDPTAPATQDTGVPDRAWQGPVGDAVGEMGDAAQARATADSGVTIWTDFWGWHVRSNRPDEIEVTVRGSQLRQKTTDDYDDSDETEGDFLTELVLVLPGGDGSTGMGFDTGFSETLEITVTSGGQTIGAGEIRLGGAEGVADENPMRFSKA